MINIRVLLIIRVLIILKYFGDLDFECYINIYVCVCRERKREEIKKKKWRLVYRKRKREEIKKKKKNGDLSVYIYTSSKPMQCTEKAIKNEI